MRPTRFAYTFLWRLSAALAWGGLCSGVAAASNECPLLQRDPIGQPSQALVVAQTLEAAWNAGDVGDALVLFADDAHAASSSGMRWQGRAELAAFLLQMSNPGGVSPAQASKRSRVV